MRLGEWYRARNDLAAAKAEIARALELRQQVLEVEESASARTEVVVTLHKLAMTEYQVNEIDEGAEHHGQALRHLLQLKETQQLLPRYEPWIPELSQGRLGALAFRAKELAEGGDQDGALDRIQKIVADAGGSASGLYDAACVYGQCAKVSSPPAADRYIDKGLDVLEQAINNGWTDVEKMNSDPDLELLRERPRYEPLMGRLE